MKTLPEIRAKVGPNYLQNIDRKFDGSITTVFRELIQNSRRAKATKLDVRLIHAEEGAVRIQFSDDGEGLESPAILLNLSGSGWGSRMDAEDPAGEGFFSLSAYDKVFVASRNWEATFDLETFKGQKPLDYKLVDFLPEKRKGMYVSWVCKSCRMSKIQQALEGCLRFSGLDATLTCSSDGGRTNDTTEYKSRDFMEDCFLVEDFTDTLGCRIGLSWKPLKMDHNPSTHQGNKYNVLFNFKGLILSKSISAFIIPSARDEELPFLRVDVTDARLLPLVLPARNAIKESSILTSVMEQAERMALENVAGSEHELPFSVYQRALELGVDIGPACIKLNPIHTYGDYTPRRESRIDAGCGKILLIEDQHVCKALTLALTAQNKDSELPVVDGYYLCCPDYYYTGYEQYDNLPTVSGVHLHGALEGKRENYTSLTDAIHDSGLVHECASKLSVEFYTEDGRSLFAPLRYIGGSALQVVGDGAYVFRENLLYIDARAMLQGDVYTNIEDAVDYVMDVVDRDAGDIEEFFDKAQSEEALHSYVSRVKATLLRMLVSKRDAELHLLVDLVANISKDLKSEDSSWTLQKEKGSDEIKIKTVE